LAASRCRRFFQWQLPLHSGRILDMPGRILMSLMGMMVAMLSVTGLVIWACKRRSRALQVSRQMALLAVAKGPSRD
jgi:uncharacterized iron-regulated membrane protein